MVLKFGPKLATRFAALALVAIPITATSQAPAFAQLVEVLRTSTAHVDAMTPFQVGMRSKRNQNVIFYYGAGVIEQNIEAEAISLSQDNIPAEAIPGNSKAGIVTLFVKGERKGDFTPGNFSYMVQLAENSYNNRSLGPARQF